MPNGNGANVNIKNSLTRTAFLLSEVLVKAMSPVHLTGMLPLTTSYALSISSVASEHFFNVSSSGHKSPASDIAYANGLLSEIASLTGL